MLDTCILNFFLKILYPSSTIKLAGNHWSLYMYTKFPIMQNYLRKNEVTHLCQAIPRISTLVLHVSVVGAIDATALRQIAMHTYAGLLHSDVCMRAVSMCKAGRAAGIAKAPGRTSINTGLSLLVWVLSGQGVSPGKQPREPAVSNVTVCCQPGSASFSFSFSASSTDLLLLSLTPSLSFSIFYNFSYIIFSH